jgi:hypothetical protein
MRKVLLFAVMLAPAALRAQNALTSDLVEGGKTLVELIKVIRTPRTSAPVTTSYINTDSCGAKKLADISFKNKTDKIVQVSLFLRLGNVYDIKPLVLTLAASSQESLYEVKAGVYKYKIETDEAGQRIVMHEGELKLQPCDKAVKEIKPGK